MKSKRVRILKGVALLVLSTSLFACGGGSEQVQLPAVNAPLSVTSGTALTVAYGNSLVFSVNGGGGGKTFTTYSASSSNSSVVTTSLNGSKLTVTGIMTGTANVTVMDSAGASYLIAITVPKASDSGTPLAVSAPNSVTLAFAESPVYEISGGKPPYKATSAAASIVKAVVVQNPVSSAWELRLTGESAGSALVNLRDSVGALISTNVTVLPSAPKEKFYTLAPSTASIVLGAAPAYKVSGGVPPYSTVSSAAAIATSQIVGDNVVISAKLPGTSTVFVYDSTGASLSTAITVTEEQKVKPAPLKGAAPSSVNVVTGESPSYSIFGGTPPYKAVTSSESVVSSSVQTTGTNSVMVLNGKVPGSANVSIFDSLGETFSINVTVSNATPAVPLYTTAAPSMTFAFGEIGSFGIGGGAKPYTVMSSASGILSAALANGDTITLKALASGSATVYIRDSAGVIVQSTVNVSAQSAGAQLYTSSPSTVSLFKGTSTTYSIGGGTSPYTVGSGAPGVMTASISGGSLILNAIDVGTSIISIRDAAGAVVSINAAVTTTSSQKLFTTAPSSINLSLGASPTYQIGGGVAPYKVASSDTTRVSAAISGNVLTVTGSASGTAVIVVSDDTGSTVNIVVNVSGGPSNAVLYTDAPASISVVKGVVTPYSVGGGSGSYSVTSSAPGIVTGSISGSVLSVTAVEIGSGILTVRDGAGSTVSINVSVTSSTPNKLFTTAPSQLVVKIGASPTYSIGGGIAAYTAVSSNAAVLTASVSGNTLTLTGVAAGTANVVVSDTTGATVTIAVVIE